MHRSTRLLRCRSVPVLTVAALALALAAAGCAKKAGPAVAEDPTAQPGLGKNLVGEECRATPGHDALPDPNSPAPIDIVCGKSTSLAGVLHTSFLPLGTPLEGAGRRDAIERASKLSPAAVGIAARLSCQAGRWFQTPDGNDAEIAPCMLRDGNWPQIVLTLAVGKTLYQAEGLPSMLPVFANAIALQTGAPVALGEVAASSEQLSAMLGNPMPAFGTGDLNDYKELIRTARIYNSSRNSGDAEAAYRRALEIQTRIFGEAAPGVGETVMALALEVSNQGRFDEAAGLFRRAAPIVDRSPDPLARARLASYQALDAANQGHYADALRYAKAATALRRSQIDTSPSLLGDAGSAGSQSANRGELAHSLSIEAAMALRLDDLPNAEAAATEALQIIAETPGLPPWWRPNALSMMGEVNGREGRFAAAERNYLDALAFRQRLFGETAPTALAFIQLGRLYAGEDQLPQAVQAFRSAFAILEKDRQARSDFNFDQLAPFLKAASGIAARDAQQRPALEADMFRAIQLTAAAVADQTIARATARLAAADPQTADLARQAQEAQRRRDAARLELAEETAKPDDERGAVREAKLIQTVQAETVATDTLLRQLQTVFPAYGKLANPGSVELDELRKQLRPHEALISFAIGRNEAYGVLARNDRLVVRRLDLNEQKLATYVTDLRKAVVLRLDGILDFDLHDSYDLYKHLLQPFEAGLDGVDHLVVVASGPLASLPMSVLVTREPTGNRDYQHAAFLVRQMALSQIPSVRAFVSLREAGPHRIRPAQPMVAFGNPDFSGPPKAADDKQPSALEALAAACRGDGPIPGDLLRALTPLAESAGEIRTVAHLLGADPSALHLGKDAAEPVLRKAALDQYAVLYFATHGLLPGELRCQSEPGLVLSPPPVPAKSKDEDGLLDATEIAELKLNADLVVLSACNTAAAGGRFGGEALSGLAEAFFYAGARTLLASHWSVESSSTVALMTGLFQRLGPSFTQDGATSGISEALRQSQLALLNRPETSHPIFWAAFTVIGDGGAVGSTAKSVAETTATQ